MDSPTALHSPAQAGGLLAAPDKPLPDADSPEAGGVPIAAGDEQNARRPGGLRRWLARLVSLAATLAVIGLAGLAVALTVVPALVGGHTMTVLSGSMVPEFSPGAMVVDRPADASTLGVGDVITYATTDQVTGEPILITHRIVEVRSGGAGPIFITQGDATRSPDDRPVDASQVRGEVWYSIPYIGWARNFLLAQGAPLIIGGAVGLIGSVWFLLHLLGSGTEAPKSPAAGRTSGRHRAGDDADHSIRNGAAVALLVGLLGGGGYLVTQQASTQAAFSDEQSVDVSITVGDAAAAE